MQFLHVQHCRRPDFHSADGLPRRTRPEMIIRTDDEVMFVGRFRRGEAHVPSVIRQRAELVAVVMAGNRQDRNIDSLELIVARSNGRPLAYHDQVRLSQ